MFPLQSQHPVHWRSHQHLLFRRTALCHRRLWIHKLQLRLMLWLPQQPGQPLPLQPSRGLHIHLMSQCKALLNTARHRVRHQLCQLLFDQQERLLVVQFLCSHALELWSRHLLLTIYMQRSHAHAQIPTCRLVNGQRHQPSKSRW